MIEREIGKGESCDASEIFYFSIIPWMDPFTYFTFMRIIVNRLASDEFQVMTWKH